METREFLAKLRLIVAKINCIIAEAEEEVATSQRVYFSYEQREVLRKAAETLEELCEVY